MSRRSLALRQETKPEKQVEVENQELRIVKAKPEHLGRVVELMKELAQA